eukprot:1393047-Pyramimonas_sp.AAC.1
MASTVTPSDSLCHSSIRRSYAHGINLSTASGARIAHFPPQRRSLRVSLDPTVEVEGWFPSEGGE